MSDLILQDLLMTVGEIKGTVDGMRSDLTEIKGDVKGIDSRVRRVEIRGAANGAIAGSVMAVGIELLKQKLGI